MQLASPVEIHCGTVHRDDGIGLKAGAVPRPDRRKDSYSAPDGGWWAGGREADDHAFSQAGP